MLRVPLCSSSGESTVSIHLVYVTLCRWPSSVHTRRSADPDGSSSQLIRIIGVLRYFCISGRLVFPINPDKWRSSRSLWPRGLRRAACGRSPAEIVGSNPTGGMDICLLWVLCVVRYKSLLRADHSSRGVLPTVVRRCVWSRNLKNEEAMTRVGSRGHRKKKWSSTIFLHIRAARLPN